MNNHFISIYQRSVVLVNGKQREDYILCYGNQVICESEDPNRIKEDLHRFIDNNLVL